MPLSDAQRGVAAGMAGATVLVLAAMAAAVVLMPAGLDLSTRPGRLPLVALCALLPALTLAASIGRLAGHRFFTPADINGSGLTQGTERAKLLQALLQNTLEQTALALPVYLACGMWAPPALLPALPVAAVAFLAGRALFFKGYERGAPARALGFALTFYSTVALLLGSLVIVLTCGAPR